MSLLSAIALTSPLALNLFVPAMPDAAQDLGVSNAVIQLTFTAYLFTLAIGQLLSGPLADYFGRKPVLLWGLALHVSGSLLAAVAQDITLLVAGRVLQALGGSTAMALARTMIVDIYGREGAAGKMGFMVMSIAIAQSVAPAVGGALNLWYGWNSTLLLPIVIGTAVWLASLKWLPETGLPQSGSAPGSDGKTNRLQLTTVLRQYRNVLKAPDYLGYALSTTFIAAAFYMFVGSAPFIVVNQLGGNSAQFGVWFLAVSGAFMAGSLLSTYLAQRLNIDLSVLLGNSLSLLGAALLLIFVWRDQLSFSQLFLPMALLTLGRGLSQPNAQTGAIASTQGSAGTASGLMGFIQLLTGAMMAQLTPWLMQHSLTLLMSCLLMAPLIAMICHGYSWQRRKRYNLVRHQHQ